MLERDYISALQKGDKSALQNIYHLYSERLYNSILAYLKNKEDAEEVLQDVFVTLFQKANQFEYNSSLATWLHRISINKALDHLRKKSAKKRFRNSVVVYKDGGQEPIESMVDPMHPEQEFVHNESLRRLMILVDSLPENQKIAFHITQIDGLSQQEAAEIMQISRKAVESLVSRARAKLKTQLIPFYPERDAKNKNV